MFFFYMLEKVSFSRVYVAVEDIGVNMGGWDLVLEIVFTYVD